MNPVEFLKTIYFGDRSGEWKYYLDEDIENGAIVITGVQKIIYDESGLFPNDQIYDVYATELDGGIYEFVIETSYVDEKALTHDLTFKLIGKNVYILDKTYC